MVEKESIINLSIYSSKSYATVVLSNDEVAFLGEKEDAAFYTFLFCLFFIDSIV